MKAIDIFGGQGQHATDLIDRGIFENFDIRIIGIDDSTPKESGCNGVIVGIAETRHLISKLINELITHSEIINFSGIMSTTPESINNRKNISNFHFLFGPNANQNLKVAFAGNSSENTQLIIQNSEKLGIKIIETDIETHDSKMAIIQALSHLFIILTGLSNNDNKNELIRVWKSPNKTIIDMIFENIYFQKVLIDLLNELREGTNLSELFLDMVGTNIHNKDIELFGTPNFNRVFNFARDNRVIVNDEIINLCTHLFYRKSEILAKIEKLKNPKRFTELIMRINKFIRIILKAYKNVVEIKNPNGL